MKFFIILFWQRIGALKLAGFYPRLRHSHLPNLKPRYHVKKLKRCILTFVSNVPTTFVGYILRIQQLLPQSYVASWLCIHVASISLGRIRSWEKEIQYFQCLFLLNLDNNQIIIVYVYVSCSFIQIYVIINNYHLWVVFHLEVVALIEMNKEKRGAVESICLVYNSFTTWANKTLPCKQNIVSNILKSK